MPAEWRPAAPSSRRWSSWPCGSPAAAAGTPRRRRAGPVLWPSPWPSSYLPDYNGCLLRGSFPAPAGGTEIALEGGQILRDGPARGALHGAVPADHAFAEWRQRRRPAAMAARRGVDERFLELGVHAVHEQPGRAIRHPHAAGRLADRAAVANRFQDSDLARTERPVRAQIEAQQHARHRPAF